MHGFSACNFTLCCENSLQIPFFYFHHKFSFVLTLDMIRTGITNGMYVLSIFKNCVIVNVNFTFQTHHDSKLEELREKIIQSSAIAIQIRWKGFLARKRYENLRRCAIVCQRRFRQIAVRKNFLRVLCACVNFISFAFSVIEVDHVESENSLNELSQSSLEMK